MSVDIIFLILSGGNEHELIAIGIWRSRDDACNGGSGAGHTQAMRETIKLYTEWKVERLNLIIGGGVRHWNIVEWAP